VSFLRRLEDLDRRLGLHPETAEDSNQRSWKLLFLGSALVYILAGVSLLFVGRSEWIIGLNVAAMGVFLAGAAVLLFSRFRRGP
jgi:hypothetical protein